MPLGFAIIAFKSSVLSLMYNMPVVLYLERGKNTHENDCDCSLN